VAGRIGMLPRRSVDQLDRYVWVFDLNTLMGSPPTDPNLAAQVIVVEDQGVEFGLLVNELHGVPELTESQITPVPRLPGEHSILASRLIRTNQGRLLIQVLDIARIHALLGADTRLEHPALLPDLVA
jgi:chemotaxis signal transduction protein